MINDLDKEGLALLRLLLQILKDANPSDPETFITYTEVHKRLGLQVLLTVTIDWSPAGNSPPVVPRASGSS
jgi:hypothetical protein